MELLRKEIENSVFVMLTWEKMLINWNTPKRSTKVKNLGKEWKEKEGRGGEEYELGKNLVKQPVRRKI